LIRTPSRLRLAAVLLALTSAPASATMPAYQGPMPPELSRAFAQGGFAIQPARPAGSGAAPAGLEPPSTHNLWRVPVVLVSYADSSCKFTPANFNAALFDTTGTSATGSIYDYYQWASHGRIRVIPTIVGVVKVPNTRTYYGGNFWGLDRSSTAQSDYGLVRDALSRTSPSIDWSVFDQDHDYRVDAVWVVHAGIGGELSRDTTRSDLWSINSQLTNYWLGGIAWDTPTPIPGGGSLRYQVDHFNILPELSGFDPSRISEIGVYCHEFGHALGLPDLYDTQSNGYPNAGPARWSLMAAGVYGGDGHSPQYPVRPGAWCEQYLGWTPLTRPTRDTTMVMAPIAQNGPILDVCFQGQPSADHFLVENRHRESFDRNLPNDGLLVWHADEGAIALRLPANLVNSGLTPGLAIVEGDGDKDMQRGDNLGDSSDVFPGAPPLLRTYLYDV
jgi:M6 family metalloprotease-like protein